MVTYELPGSESRCILGDSLGGVPLIVATKCRKDAAIPLAMAALVYFPGEMAGERRTVLCLPVDSEL